MQLNFNSSTGIKSLNSAKDFINDLGLRASDMKPFLKGIEPNLVQEIQHEFDASNPNKWRKISKEWISQKTSEGKPTNIGIYTGALMQAASTDAWKVYYPTGMVWKIAPVYSIDFTRMRKIGITATEWLRSLGRNIANVILGKAKNG